jgi:antiviral helicase SKI2
MLYNKSPILSTVEWVILDEVHFINDEERGVVWEEVIIMLAPTVKLVMLSATVPNFLEFANWVAMTRKQPVYVQQTDFRPVPLDHSAYINGQFATIISQDGRTDWNRIKT